VLTTPVAVALRCNVPVAMFLDRILASMYNAAILVRVKTQSVWEATIMAQTQGPQNKEANQPDPDVHPVIVVSVDSDGDKKNRRNKRGSSRASRRLEDIEDRASRSLHRVSKAVNRGVETYLDKRDASKRKRRDGALVDFWVNAATGVSETVADSAPVLTDLAKHLRPTDARKNLGNSYAVSLFSSKKSAQSQVDSEIREKSLRRGSV